MKLASMRHGRDGRLAVVSRDLTRATFADGIAGTLQRALDDWDMAGPRLADLALALEHGAVPAFRFREHDCAAPLPRAYQWLDGSAYLNHVELVRRARGSDLPPGCRTDPLIYQGGSDILLGPRDPIVALDEAHGIDFEGELAVVTGDVPVAVRPDEALAHVRLLMLANDISLRNLIPVEVAKGFGFVNSKPPTAFSPVAVTPDELGAAWRTGRLARPLQCAVNGRLFGRANAGADMTFGFGDLLAHAARTRPLGAGTIVGSGTVSNRGEDGGPGTPVGEGGRGYSCIAEQRTVETIRDGVPRTPFLCFGDVVRIEMRDESGHSIFGAIEQTVAPYVASDQSVHGAPPR